MVKNVIVVDDDYVFQIIATKMIQKSGIHQDPLVFANGEEAFNHLKEERPDPQETLIFLDLNMPILDGWGFLDNINQCPDLKKYPVIIVTSSTNEEDRFHSNKYPQVIDYVFKPLELDYLLNLARKMKTKPLY